MRTAAADFIGQQVSVNYLCRQGVFVFLPFPVPVFEVHLPLGRQVLS